MSSEEVSMKRKRKPEKEKSPSKKRAGDGIEHAQGISSSDADRIKVTHVKRHKNWVPVIASTPGLLMTPDISFAAYQHKKSNELLLHSSDHQRLDYTARENQEGGIQTHLKHYIGIFDPEKKEMQLVEARGMSVRSTLRAEEQQVRQEALKKENQSKGPTGHQELRMQFGTTKAKRTIEARSQNMIRTIKDPEAIAASPEAMKKAIQANPAAAAVLESMAEGAANAPSHEQIQAAVDEAKPRPKHNPDATTPKELYPLSEIVGDEVMKAVKVKAWFDAIDDEQDVETSSRFVAHRLKVIIEKDEADAVIKVKLLKWILILLKFYSSCKKIRGGMKVPKTGELKEKIGEDTFLIDAVKRKFVPGFGDMTKWQVDNLLTHLATYTLIVDGFETDIYDLREDLQITSTAMVQYFREAGSRVQNMTESQRAMSSYTLAEAMQHKVATLTVPPTFPKQRAYRPRR